MGKQVIWREEEAGIVRWMVLRRCVVASLKGACECGGMGQQSHLLSILSLRECVREKKIKQGYYYKYMRGRGRRVRGKEEILQECMMGGGEVCTWGEHACREKGEERRGGKKKR